MRVAVLMGLALLAACAGEKLALAPPPGVDLSGHWKLNEADSDDPQRLAQSVDPSKAAAPGQGAGGQGQGGRGRRGGGGAAGGFGGVTAPGPRVPEMGAMGAGLRWPGRDVEIKQVAGVVNITSGGVKQVFQPKAGEATPPHRHKDSDADLGPRNRDMPSPDRGDGPPAVCGWEDKTLVVKMRESDDDQPPLEKRFSLSDDGRRLIEVVGFSSGRYAGFTLSRVWDRAAEVSLAEKSRAVPGS